MAALDTPRKMSMWSLLYYSTALATAISRNFTTLTSVGAQHYKASSDILLSGDYSIKLDVYFIGELMNLTGNSANFNNRVKIRADGAVEWRASGATTVVQTSAGEVPVNKLSTIEAIRTGSNGIIKVNGVIVFNGVVPTGVCTIDQFGATNTAGTYADGIIANVEINDNGTRIVDMPIDGNYTTPAVENTVGNELVTNITTDSGSSFINGILTLVQDMGNEFAQTDASLTSGTKYLLKYTVISETLAGNNLNIADSLSGNFQVVPSTVGSHSVEITSGFTSDLRFILRNEASGLQVVMSDISIFETTGFIPETANNVVVNNATTLGSELWNDSPTSISTGWTDNLDGSYTCDGTNNALLSDNNNTISDNDVVLITYTVEPGITGTVRVLAYGSSMVGISTPRTQAGTYTEYISVSQGTASGEPTGRITVQSISNFNGTVSGISTRVIPAATPYFEAVNITSTDAEFFTQDANGDWLGDELVTQAIWETPQNPPSVNWSFANNQWTLTGDGNPDPLTVLSSVNQPKNMRITGNLSSLEGVGIAITQSFPTINERLLTAGLYSRTVNTDAAGFHQFKRISGIVNAVLDKPSIKRVVEKA